MGFSVIKIRNLQLLNRQHRPTYVYAGGRVILACRSAERAQAARDDIVKSTGNDDVIVMALDLASLTSVRQFADQFNRSGSTLLFVFFSERRRGSTK